MEFSLLCIATIYTNVICILVTTRVINTRNYLVTMDRYYKQIIGGRVSLEKLYEFTKTDRTGLGGKWTRTISGMILDNFLDELYGILYSYLHTTKGM